MVKRGWCFSPTKVLIAETCLGTCEPFHPGKQAIFKQLRLGESPRIFSGIDAPNHGFLTKMVFFELCKQATLHFNIPKL